MIALPIDEHRPKILESLALNPFLILAAPTGSGKSTRVPQFLLDKVAGTIYVLEPRVLAAKLLATRVAEELKVTLGETVGYLTRHEKKVSPQTKIIFVTEGLFFRILKNNPSLSGIGAILLDEFHERNLYSDLVLAFLKAKKDQLPLGLKVVVMSATLDKGLLENYLAAPLYQTEGRTYPVTISYLGLQDLDPTPLWEQATKAVKLLLKQGTEGDGLIFIPGAFEIRKTIDTLNQTDLGEKFIITSLYGEMSKEEQERSLREPLDLSQRKIIVATNIAETSITLPRIRWVVDSGFVRMARFNSNKNIDVLSLERISQASAVQRSGRAGRTAPGIAMRLWSENKHQTLASFQESEIKRIDLAESLLQVIDLGYSKPQEFPWLEAPLPEQINNSTQILKMIGALNPENHLTEIGKNLANLPIHPRLARFIFALPDESTQETAILWASLLNETSILVRTRYEASNEKRYLSDFSYLVEKVKEAEAHHFELSYCNAIGLHAGNTRKMIKGWEHLASTLGLRRSYPQDLKAGEETLIRALLLAFPDRVAIKESKSSTIATLMTGLKGALSETSHIRGAELFITSEIFEIPDRREKKRQFSLNSEIELSWLTELFPHSLITKTTYLWNELERAVDAEEQICFENLILSKKKTTPQLSLTSQKLAEAFLENKFILPHWNEAVLRWMNRVRLCQKYFPEENFLSYSPEDLSIILQEIFEGARTYKEIKDRPCLDYVKNAMSWNDQERVEKLCPEGWTLKNGQTFKIIYQEDLNPSVSVRLQKLYDETVHPTILGGRLKILVDILAPNQRTLQKTTNLPDFWTGSYLEIRKEMAGRYPKHDWR